MASMSSKKTKTFNKCCLIFIVTISILSSVVNSDKILGVAPVPAYSHFSVGFRIFKELADRGHEVTVISPYPQKTPIKNYKDIPIVEITEVFKDLKVNFFELNKMSPIVSILFGPNIGGQIANGVLEHKNVQTLLKSNEQFDLVIMESFLCESLMALSTYYKVPLVMISPLPATVWSNHYVGNPESTAFIPNVSSGLAIGMNFWERFLNFVYDSLTILKWELIFMRTQANILKKHFPDLPDLSEIRYNTSIFLINSHESFTPARPHVPNMIEIGGYHINPRKELQSDVKAFLDSATDGAILFSMGSNARSADIPIEKRQGIIKALSNIKQKVLWKFEEEISDLPSHIKIVKWLSQQDILAHPNIVAFISHGGLLGTIESTYFGVPIIGIPIFGDQKTNVANAVKNGYAIAIQLDDLNEDNLSKALKEITGNPKYREEAKRRSTIMHDRPVKPIDSAVYWIEYAIKHKGATHLRSPVLKLKWYQQHLLDVYAVLGAITMVFTVIFIFCLKLLFGLCSSKKEKKKAKTSISKKNK